ncbi:HflC protein [Hahella chejuensis KCTC 2396]|uniref:Protein HflC n=1 Tax=Hahella chejuensis (strain KCTC 2396) TaxID=349521 RepID=Q2SBC5_HAHCH|nr:protease modulator HflC [Hahella chejuensis]ABC32049.1 HflC protein [Hahella chejuensis KCTC 2396]
MTTRFAISLGAILLAIIVVMQGVYIVPETHRAVLLRFGGMVESDIEAGLHFKIPFVDVARKFDIRVLVMDLPTKSYLTGEQKPLDVDSYATWRIVNVGQFYRSTAGDENNAVRLLESRIDNGLRDQFGRRTMHEVVAGEREELMEELTKSLDQIARAEFGIEINDIRVRAIELPTRVSDSVYERMESERLKIAQQHRSQGEEQAEAVRAAADAERTVIDANAYKEAEQLRGEGDSVASKIYADAFSKNPEFYSFYRSMGAYEQTFSSKGDLLILQPDSEFLRYLKQPQGASQGN